MSIPVLKSGELLRFVVSAMQWDKYSCLGSELSIAKAMTFRRPIDRHIAVLVHKAKRGLHEVLDWEAVESLG